MMRLFRKKDGFTLVELLIVILTGTIVTAAATTILLLAMRINRKTLDTVERQSIMRIMQSVFEDMGSDGDYVFTDNAIAKKKENNEAGDPVISFKDGKIVAGKDGDSVLMDDVTKFLLSKTDTPFNYVRGLYTFSIESKGETYVSSVYGRAQDDEWFADDPALDYESARNKLVDIAASQIGSVGQIQKYKNIPYDRDYNLWYLDRTTAEGYTGTDWSTNTAWCSVFVSWVMEQVNNLKAYDEDEIKFDNNDNPILYLTSSPAKDANVNYLWLETYARIGKNNIHIYGDDYYPQPGDLIFFTDVTEHSKENLANLENLDYLVLEEGKTLAQTIRNEINKEKLNLYIHNVHVPGVSTSDECFLENKIEGLYDEIYNILEDYLGVTGDGLDHVGIVAKVEYKEVNGKQVPEYVYTIEGNVGSKVIMRKFPFSNTEYDDATLNTTGPNKLLHIFGYATLNWNEAYK